ncbi:MAG: amino acid-binding protein [Candidatus Micrarchaeota archaeon]
MWKKMEQMFVGLPGRKAVVLEMVRLGLRVDEEGRICCGNVEIKENSLAKAASVDRRVVRAAAKSISKDRFLREVFLRIQPAGTFLKDVAPLMGFGVVEIEAQARVPGIIAKATGLLAAKKMVIRQVYAMDPELFENPTLVIITEREVPGKLLNEFKRIRGVRKVSVY